MTRNDVIARLARANPVSEADVPTAASMEAQTLKMRVLLAEIAESRPEIVPPTRRHWRRRWLSTATATAVVIATLAALPPLLREEPLGASPAAAAVLERAADAATAYSSAAAGRYAYTKARTLYAVISADRQPFTVLLPSVRETWVAADGSGRLVESKGQPNFLGRATAHAGWRRDLRLASATTRTSSCARTTGRCRRNSSR